jgi:predicted nucleic acid-binding protein
MRISMQPAIAKRALSGSEALELLDRNLQRAGHEFWAEDLPVTKALVRVRDRLVGHKQVMDAFLLSLATRRNQKLATFDQGVLALLPPDAPESRHVTVIRASVRRARK